MTFLADLEPDEVQARFAWAKRRGLPKWLWPDIHPKLWRAALSDLAKALDHILSNQPGDILLDGDPRILSLAAYTSGTGPLLGHFVEGGKLRATSAVSAMLAFHLMHNRGRMEMLRKEAITATRLLADKDIHAIVAKGMHTAFAYFPEPGCRPVSDIDLIVRPDELERAEEIFRSHGYRGTVMSQVPYQCDWAPAGVPASPRSLLHVHACDPWSIDLQTTLDRHLKGLAVVPLDRSASNRQLATWPVSGNARVVKQPLLLTLLAAHASQHLINLSLLRLVELALVVRADEASGELDWDALMLLLNAIGPRYVYPAFFACERLLPGTIAPAVLRACEADAPAGLRRLLARRAVSNLQPLDHHSFAERYMWISGWRSRLRRIASELNPGSVNRTPMKAIAVYLNRARSLRHMFVNPDRPTK
jgi:hypothetical protein